MGSKTIHSLQNQAQFTLLDVGPKLERQPTLDISEKPAVLEGIIYFVLFVFWLKIET